ncbi:unnamed protein product [Linum trigynum]|uniref:Uncharacterized protein n=1 Tax=Linum trigynum TaxID=586398 RepID=A0AAV2FEX8_9ROSI
MGSKLVSLSKVRLGTTWLNKLQVEVESRRWSFVMDDLQISWLQGVLQTAAMRKWVFPSKCIKKSGPRTINVGKGLNRRGAFLQVSEQETNGKVYKIIIPQAETSVGWARLTSLMKDFY